MSESKPYFSMMEYKGDLVKNSYLSTIKQVYEKFPNDYINDLKGWSFSRDFIESNSGKLLTLDLDYGSYCSLNCPHCFRKSNFINRVKQGELQSDDLKKIIIEAKKLGLRQIKFLGKGEPLENEGFLEFLEFLKEQNIWSIIFTKAHMIGDDTLTKKYFEKYNINTGEELVQKLKELNVSLVVGFNAIDADIQDKMVGDIKGTYTPKRNRALALLVKYEFNKTTPTRLAVGVNPVTKDNIHEAIEIYKWARLRNIYVVLSTTMVSGRAKEWMAINPTNSEIIELYQNIYKFNMETNLQTLKQIQSEGISSYAGGHPCSQVATGLYITLKGEVLMCPGSEEKCFGNIFEDTLENIWLNSGNYKKRKGIFNCHCPAKDGKSLPHDLYKKVLNN